MSPVISRPEDAATAFADAWNRHDMDDFAALFAEGANFVNVVGMWWKNRTEIERAHRATHETMFRDSRLEGVVSSVGNSSRPCIGALYMDFDRRIRSGWLTRRNTRRHSASGCDGRTVGLADKGGSKYRHRPRGDCPPSNAR
ncbi:SgcJ/EcaC family oxidoreductase [Mesorhizobium captivum]|uniref:SgcJ/EcaC family oxidoreductase n=1 Tax=Mesorhizobium captivum TaxID=3072319 RepID=UPI002A2467FF|nr:SgcJ/EcaC family oxidoreductase [Mesorhizobium sp. VK3C]MDX8450453.1 SgcJ/EcaC family oxidoreductase [Mesorhizobium sp. VK3C]